MSETTTGSSERLQMGKPVELVDTLTRASEGVYERFLNFRARHGTGPFTLLELREADEQLKQEEGYEYYCVISTGGERTSVPDTFLRHTT